MRVTPLAARVRLLAAAAAAIILTVTAGAPVPVEAQARPSPGPLTYDRVLAVRDARARGLNYIPGEVLIKFRKGVVANGHQRALNALRSRPSITALRWVGELALLRDSVEPNAHVLAKLLSAQPDVMYAEPNYIYTLPKERAFASRPFSTGARPAFTPNDPDFNLQWNFGANVLNMRAAWDVNPGGDPDVIVAVVDTGITVDTLTLNLPIPTAGGIIVTPIPFAPSSQLPVDRFVTPFDFAVTNSPTVLDLDGHGTHVSSTIAELTDNGVGVAGVAFRVSIMPVKVCAQFWDIAIVDAASGDATRPPAGSGFCATSDIVAGVNHAVNNGARVINISLGGPGASNSLRDALANAVARGVFVSVAMGNEFNDGNPTSFPAGFADNIDGMVAVAAINRNKTRAGYSNTGPHCEIAAPGGDFAAAGAAGLIFQTTLNQDDNAFNIAIPRFDRHRLEGFQGTSMATPHVAGVAALIISQNRGISPAALERLLTGTAEDLGSPGRDNSFGFGLVKAFDATRGQGVGR
jgi:serine protease